MDDVNQAYQKEETKQKIRKTFLHGDFPAVILKAFFSKEFYEGLIKKVSSLHFKKDIVVLHHSYAVSNFKISSKEFCDFISFVIKKKVEEVSFTAYSLTWKDYLILHDRYVEKPGIDIIIDVTDHWNTEWGGVVTYTDGRGNYYPLSPAENSLALVERKKGLNKYLQYINHYGKEKNRILLVATV